MLPVWLWQGEGDFFGKADFGWAPSLTSLFSWAQAGSRDCDHRQTCPVALPEA